MPAAQRVQIAVHRAHAAAGIEVDGVGDGAVVKQLAALQIDAARAKLLDGAHVVADVKHRAPPARDVGHLAQALLLEANVAHGQHLVANEDVRVQMGGHGEGQFYVHAGAVPLHRRVDEGLDLGKLDDLLHLFIDLGAAHALDGAV